MKLMDMFELCYCVNLDHRKDRWEQSQKEFEKIGISPQRFSAIQDDPPWVGCWRSHITILKEAQRQNKNVFIFEDDIEFVDYAKPRISDALAELDYAVWHMFYLGGNILRPFFQTTEFLARLTHCQSTHAYGVNKKFLGTLIPFLEQNKNILDVLYANTVVPQTCSYITIPMLAIQRASYSDIEGRIMDYSIPSARYNQFLVRNDRDVK